MATDSALAQFTISTERYDGGIAIRHQFKDCNWEQWAVESLADTVAQAAAHAEVCDGKPQQRLNVGPSVVGEQFMSLWGPTLEHALSATTR